MLDYTDYFIAILIVLVAGLLYWGMYICFTKLLRRERDGIKDPVFLAAWIHLFLVEGKRERAIQECRKMIDDINYCAGPRLRVLDSVACIPIFWDHPEMVAIAMEAMDKAMENEPNSITLMGTKGSLLIEDGKLDEGVHLLKEVQRQSKSENDLAISSYYVAYAAFKRGDTRIAKELLREAKEKYPKCIVASRIEEKITVNDLPTEHGLLD